MERPIGIAEKSVGGNVCVKSNDLTKVIYSKCLRFGGSWNAYAYETSIGFSKKTCLIWPLVLAGNLSHVINAIGNGRRITEILE